MPSFCCPLGFGPKPAMMRPLTGQRNEGPASADLAGAAAGDSVGGLTTNVCCGCSLVLLACCFGTGATFGGGPARVLGCAFDAVARGATPGMIKRSPSLRGAVGS